MHDIGNGWEEGGFTRIYIHGVTASWFSVPSNEMGRMECGIG